MFRAKTKLLSRALASRLLILNEKFNCRTNFGYIPVKKTAGGLDRRFLTG